MFETESQSYYEILDLKPDATQTEIRNAYFRIKSAYAKDSAALYSIFDEHESHVVLERIEQAYLVLSSEAKRKEYDKVHGFLKLDNGVSTSQSSENIFSFAQSAEKQSTTSHDDAMNILGGGTTFEDNENPNKTNQSQNKNSFFNSSIESTKPKTTEKLIARDTVDYSTPRTLNDNRFGGEVESFSSQETIDNTKPYENKLGIIKRIDIVKSNSNNENTSEFENVIKNEVEFRGAFLKKVREYRGISIEDLSNFTKISKTYINCIESEEFENLPAAVYIRGFIVQIAKALKIQGDKAANAYMNFYKQTYMK